MIKIGIVAGEASGDQLGAGLITAIKERVPDAVFEGIAGPKMIAAGCKALYPTEKLAVMGLVEVLGHLRELLLIRKQLKQHFLENPPDVFIGIDAPDFNLTLEGKLRAAGIRTVHYVSPTIWAWRQRRVKQVARDVDLMLTLFPFESDFYLKHKVPVCFVGHPLADLIPFTTDAREARQHLGLPAEGTVVALLPGSRKSELLRLGPQFLLAAKALHNRRSSLRFLAPMISDQTRGLFENLVTQYAADLPITVLNGSARESMAASDIVLVASGTASLEAMLLKRPMVVAYRLSPITYWIMTRLRLLKISHYSLPNLLAGKQVVQEFIQRDASPEKLANAVSDLLDHPEESRHEQEVFAKIHQSLRRDANARAADAVLELLSGQPEYTHWERIR
jgi:lipid-A-disaccharide synthase